MAELTAGKGGTYYPPFPVLGLASNGGQIFLTAGGGGASASKEVPNVVQAHKYDEATGKLGTIASLNTDKSVVIYVAYSPCNSLWLACAGACCKVLELSEEENTLTELCSFVTELEGKEQTTTVARWSPIGDLIATGGTDGVVKVWKTSQPSVEPKLHLELGKEKEMLDIDFSPDGKFLASCHRGAAAHLWDLSDGSQKAKITYPVAGEKVSLMIRGVRFIPGAADKPPILVVGATAPRGPAYVGLFGGTDGVKITEVKLDQKTPITAMATDMAGKMVAFNMVNGTKRVYSLPGLKCVTKSKEVHELPAPCTAFLGEATTVSGSGDRSIHLLNYKGGGGGASALVYMFAVLIVLLIICSLILRIGIEGASVGQGEL